MRVSNGVKLEMRLMLASVIRSLNVPRLPSSIIQIITTMIIILARKGFLSTRKG